jgi:hypothetical protein
MKPTQQSLIIGGLFVGALLAVGQAPIASFDRTPVDHMQQRGVETSATTVLVGGSQPPVGTVVAWLKSLTGTPPLPSNWVQCNGQVLDDPASPYHGQIIPDLNGVTSSNNLKVLQGKMTSGGVGAGLDSGGSVGMFTNHPGDGNWPFNSTHHTDSLMASRYGSSASGDTAITNPVHDFGQIRTYAVVWIIKVNPSSEGSACPGDTDGDGVVGFADLIRTLSGWGPCP